MSLRTSIPLKVFAILLFSFELLAPAFINIEVASRESAPSHDTIISEAHFDNIIAMLVMEEASSEEKDGRDHKVEIGFTDLGFVIAFLHIVDAEPPSTHWPPSHEQVGAQPPLFTLYRSFLI